VSWRVTVRHVRAHDGGARWTLDATTEEGATTVCADVIGTTVLWLQSDDFADGTGNTDLDALVIQHIRRLAAHREVVRQLDAIERAQT